MKIWQFILIVGMGVFSMAMATPALADSSFQQVYSNTPADYYRRVSPRGELSRNIYKSGGRQTSAANMTPIARATKYAGREAHVIREEVTVDGTWLKFTVGHHVVGWMLNAGMSQSYLRLNVPVIAQRPQLPTGCEITATAMMLRYSGAAVTKTALAREMPRSKNKQGVRWQSVFKIGVVDLSRRPDETC